MPNDSSPGSTPLPAKPAPISRRRWWIHLILITAYLLVVGAVGWSRSGSHVPVLSDKASSLLFVCALELLIFGLVFGLAWLASRANRDDLMLRWRGGFWPVPLGIGYSVALRLAVGLVMIMVAMTLILTHLMTPESLRQVAVTHRPDVEVLVDLSAMRHDPVYFWLVLTLVSFVVAGLREELWRSAFLAGLRAVWPLHFGSRAGQIGAVAIAAVLFGIGHLAMGWIAVCLAAILGVGLGLIMVLHRSIWPAVIAHGAFDATSLALIPWAMDQLKHYQQMLGH
jgi:membrane protease YdiL (CAAX protease family)